MHSVGGPTKALEDALPGVWMARWQGADETPGWENTHRDLV